MMRTSSFKVAALAAALAMTAGCGKKAPRELPPAPASAEGTATTDSGESAVGPSGGVGNAPLPGSRADFVQHVRSDRILFETDSSTIDDDDRSVLDSQVAWLAVHPAVRVTIEGHCDERGTREYNLALGDRRANAAKNYLAARGVDPARMTVISWGKEKPEALGSDETAWAQNRRAVTVLPN
jgi:peptidoglycan-associated lipoprotein